ncbi:hypothetical protein ACF0H5_018566 [Mactra antiquata]
MKSALMLFIIVVLLLKTVYSQPPPPLKQCIAQVGTSDQCKCKMTDDGSVIDITSLGVANAPKFKDVEGSDGYKYSYDPCNSFSEGGCQDSAMCRTSGELQTTIGEAGHMEYQYDMSTKNVIVAYIAREGPRIAVSEVELICDPTACKPTFEAIGVQQEFLYKFKLTSVCACANSCTESGPMNCHDGSGGAIGGGTIVIIIAIVGIVLYITAGVLYQKIRNNATGADLIPNKDLWKSMPGLIKGGFLFVFSKCLPNRARYTSTN